MSTTRPRPYVGRFAPTPSGALHLGSLVAALGSWLDARAHQGRWLLRLDDLDAARCRPEHAATILAQLHDHGLIPDNEPIIQSQRSSIYAHALQNLIAQGHAYRCACRRTALRAAVQQGDIREGWAGPIYPGTCRRHPPEPNATAGWRFAVPIEPVAFNDRVQGVLRQSLTETVGDPLLQRSDGVIAYHLAEVVDNQAMGISHVVRGADLAELTPLHLALHPRLYPNAAPPAYAHIPIVQDAAGRKLSKTNHAPALNGANAQDNLRAAARHLQLSTADSPQPISALLEQWVAQWPDWLKQHGSPGFDQRPPHGDSSIGHSAQ